MQQRWLWWNSLISTRLKSASPKNEAKKTTRRSRAKKADATPAPAEEVVKEAETPEAE